VLRARPIDERPFAVPSSTRRARTIDGDDGRPDLDETEERRDDDEPIGGGSEWLAALSAKARCELDELEARLAALASRGHAEPTDAE